MTASAVSMAGKTAVVTGATSGIGLETARELARMGAFVILGVRDAARGRLVAENIARAGGRAEVLAIDLASFASIRQAAALLASAHPRLDVLVNNAGIAVGGRELSADGHERTWATNFLGPFLLTQLLLPVLRAAPEPRVVNVSSEGHRMGALDWGDLELERRYRTFPAYANSKLAMILWTRELSRREPGVAVNALHPGAIATNIWRSLPAVLRGLIKIVLPSPKRGARPVVRLASDPALAGVSGRYYDRFAEKAPSRAARDDAAAVRLWEVASSAVGDRGQVTGDG